MLIHSQERATGPAKTQLANNVINKALTPNNDGGQEDDAAEEDALLPEELPGEIKNSRRRYISRRRSRKM